MLKLRLDAHDFFDQVVLRLIRKHGLAVVLKHNKIVVLYSGPDRNLMKVLSPHTQFNWELGINQATRLDASLIDTTYLARFLNRMGLENYFGKVYSTPKTIKPFYTLKN